MSCTLYIFKGFQFFEGCIILCICVICVIALVQPYESPYRFYNKLDIFMLSTLLLYLLGLIQISKYGSAINVINSFLLEMFLVYSCVLIPTVYFSLKVLLSVTRLLYKYSRKKNYQKLNNSQQTPKLNSNQLTLDYSV